MVQKIIDIIPPGEKEVVPVPRTNFVDKPEIPVKEKEDIPKRDIKKEPPFFVEKKRVEFSLPKIPNGGIITLVLLFAIIIGAGCYFTLSKTDIYIWPETELKSFEKKATIDKSVSNLDIPNSLIPGKVFEAEKIFLEDFASTGKIMKDVKAEGVIRVYNSYSDKAQVLISNTRFMSAEGKLFRSIERVTVPGATFDKGKFVAESFIDVRVRADKAGPEYNIGASTFSIPGFVGTDKYTKFYGKSTEAMKGGEAQEVSQVTAEDLEKAKNAMIEMATKESVDALKLEIPQDFVVSDKFLKTDIIEAFPSVAVKAETDKFTYQAKIRSAIMTFKKADIDNFAREFILKEVAEDKTIYEKSLEVDYSPDNIDLASGKIIVTISARAKIYSAVSEISLKEGLVGKSLIETKMFLENRPQTVKSEVNFWPFWVKKVPSDLEKVNLQLRFD